MDAVSGGKVSKWEMVLSEGGKCMQHYLGEIFVYFKNCLCSCFEMNCSCQNPI